MLELSIICGANPKFVADSIFSGNHIYRQQLSLKITRIQSITLKNNYAKIVLICEVSPIIFEIIEEHVSML